ncbi:hypothetical protein [Nonomuraea sp. SYSU D8015]|uniref:hypothetical protein n=1 Tax=Nonomuraea sp. SYSU D8015 TaxID=2593644 RepID=UPI0016605C28|nr:hypothetical protein [Nonomuraea sp. SYSU D8015]
MADVHDRTDDDAGTPRWAKVAGIIAAVLVLLFVVLMLTGGHGPGRHFAAGSAVAGLMNS